MKKHMFMIVMLVFSLLAVTACTQSNQTLASFETGNDLSATIEAFDNQTKEADGIGYEIITEYFLGGDLWIFRDVNELSSRATDIVRAKILDSRVELINTLLAEPDPNDDMERFYMIHTVYRLNILEVFKGDSVIGGTIEVMQIGGRYGNRELVYFDRLPLNHGDEFIFFIRSYESEGFGHLPMSITGAFQGVFRLPSILSIGEFQGLLEAYAGNHLNADEVLKGLSPNNHITLTIGDLVRISD